MEDDREKSPDDAPEVPYFAEMRRAWAAYMARKRRWQSDGRYQLVSIDYRTETR
jgi:hypothetical protein